MRSEIIDKKIPEGCPAAVSFKDFCAEAASLSLVRLQPTKMFESPLETGSIIMVAEIFGSVAAIKSALDIAKNLKDIDDATKRNEAVLNLHEKILAAYAEQNAQIETIRDLKGKLASLDAWVTRKQRYTLHAWNTGDFSYRLKEGVQPAEPSHHICTACYEENKAFILNREDDRFHDRLKCPHCGLSIKMNPNDVAERENEQIRRLNAEHDERTLW